MAVILIIKTEDGEITELPLLSKITIGRSSSSDYTIKDNKMSAIHCSFEVTSLDQVMFTDLGSSNGSYCNNSKVAQILFKINDLIQIGNTTVKIEARRLNSSEKKAIGVSTFKPSRNDKTLPSITHPKKVNDEVKNVGGDATKKKTSISSKVVKFRPPATLTNRSNELEQEPSTGETKLLKLDKISKTKKN